MSVYFYVDTCEGSLERTRQITVGAVLVDSLASLPYISAKKNSHVMYN